MIRHHHRKRHTEVYQNPDIVQAFFSCMDTVSDIEVFFICLVLILDLACTRLRGSILPPSASGVQRFDTMRYQLSVNARTILSRFCMYISGSSSAPFTIPILNQ